MSMKQKKSDSNHTYVSLKHKSVVTGGIIKADEQINRFNFISEDPSRKNYSKSPKIKKSNMKAGRCDQIELSPNCVIQPVYSTPKTSSEFNPYLTTPRSERNMKLKKNIFRSPPPPSLRKSPNLFLSNRKITANGRTPEKITPFRTKSSPSRNKDDRFIPNRSLMQEDICRASVLVAEKRRLAIINKKVSERNRSTVSTQENGNANAFDSPSSNHSSTLTQGDLTPIQSEFRLRMRGALLNVPLEEMGMRRNRMNSSNGNAIDMMGSLGSSQENRENLDDLVYGPLTETNDMENNTSCANQQNRDYDQCGKKLLSFRGSIGNDNGSGLDYSEGLSSSGYASPNVKSRLTRKSRHSSIVPDPYYHDQLHVLHRAASSKASSGRFIPGYSESMIDMLSGIDAGFRDVATKVGRRINAAPTRILDAPELVDDYYLNLVSWSQDNMLAVALGQCVYLWDASSGSIKHLLTLQGEDDYVTSVQWTGVDGHSKYIAIGTNNGPVQLWDAEAEKRIRSLNGHTARVGSLSWNKHILSSGGRDSLIIQHDVRVANHIVSTYVGHNQEVCGLKWNDDGTTLASGGNENFLCIWDAAMSRRNNGHNNGSSATIRNQLSPRLVLTQHQAAVKALAWCPFHRGLLASGGGTADRTIKFWNTSSGALLNSIDTGSQVCSLLWSKHQREICSSHGFSENQLILWKYPTMAKIQEFKGHTARVLHMDQSPDGACVVSAAADETLRFWNVFGSPPNKTKKDNLIMGSFANRITSIR